MGILTGQKPVTFIVTTDRERAKAFYGEVLGLLLTSDDPFASVFDLAGIALRISTVGELKPGMHTVLGWEVADIRSTVSALSERGVTFTVYPGFGQDELGIWSPPGGTAKVAWFTDPDGNVLSVTQH